MLNWFQRFHSYQQFMQSRRRRLCAALLGTAARYDAIQNLVQLR